MMDTILGKLKGNKELDIRLELKELFEGIDFSKDKGITFLHRKIRIDNKGKRVKCYCNTVETNSGKTGCPNCDGEGYVWDEKFIKAYPYNERYISFTTSYNFTKNTGREFNESYIFLSEFKNKIENGDRLYEFEKDQNGKIITPFIPRIEFLITANRYIGIVENTDEYTLAVGEIVSRNDYIKRANV